MPYKNPNKPNQSSDAEILEFFKIIPSGMVVYRQTAGRKTQYYSKPDKSLYLKVAEDHEEEKKVPPTKTYTGIMTASSKRRMSKSINLLLEIAEKKKVINPSTNKKVTFRLAFQSLTLSAPQHPYTDKEIKKELFERYLRKMRNKGMKNYIWKAEQQKNGNIHFHIVTDTFIVWSDIRNTWNNIQNRLEFIDYFESKFAHRDPNSTDVKFVIGEKITMAYLMKYMLKDEQQSEQLTTTKDNSNKCKGKIWDCSKNLKLKNDSADFLTDRLWSQIVKLIESGKVKVINEDFYKILLFPKYLREKFFAPEILKPYNSFLDKVRGVTEKTTI